MKKYLTAIANFYILLSIVLMPLVVIHKLDKLSEKFKQPIIIYQTDNTGIEMIGKVTGKDVVDGHYYVEVKPYGKFLVTEEQYYEIEIGQDMPEYLKGRKQMNKQEAIKQLGWHAVLATYIPKSTEVVKFEIAKDIISQIHEPQKVVVPKFVAEHLEYAKAERYSLYGAMEMVEEDSENFNWLFNGHKGNQENFARAWLFGYEVEKERLYTVEIPNPNLNVHTILQRAEKGLVLVVVTNARWRGWSDSKL
ncbi:TPA: DUF1372 family protein, partial [Streptococcus suis]